MPRPSPSSPAGRSGDPGGAASGRLTGIAGVLGVACLLSVTPVTTTAPALGPTDAITVERLETHLRVIASDDLEGREPLSPGFRAAADYVSGVLREIQATPLGGEGTYLQPVTMRRTRIEADGTYARIGSRTFRHGRDLLGSGHGSASGRVVYVGHGWRVPSKGIDPFAGVDVRGALVLVLPVVPAGVTFDELAALEEDRGWFGPESNAKRFGARGILRVGGHGEAASWPGADEPGRAILSVDRLDEIDPPLPAVTLDAAALDALMEGERESGASLRARLSTREPGPSFPLDPGKPVEIVIATTVERADTFNVVAAVAGSDPALQHEFVALGAHLDHIGRREGGPRGGDDINNGADDDGSGVVALLEIAAAVARGPRPPRSLLFVWHTGEEAGGWGSRYFTAFPPVPLDRIVAQLNLDMIGRSRPRGPDGEDAKLSGPHELFLVGARQSSRDLGERIAQVNREFLGLTLNTKYDVSGHPERIYERSDHYQYAKKGIPVAFFFSGLHDDYHRPTDEVDRIDFVKLQKVARTVLAVAWRLASDPTRPERN